MALIEGIDLVTEGSTDAWIGVEALEKICEEGD